MPKKYTTKKTKKNTAFPVKISLSFKSGNSFLVITAYNIEHIVPVKRINFEDLLTLHLENAQGFICHWNTNVYYADHPTIFQFETFTFDLLHDGFDSFFTIACLSQIAFYSTFSEKLTARTVECDSYQNYSLKLTLKPTAYTYAEIQREDGQNPNQPRTCIIFRKSAEINVKNRVYPLKEVSRKELLKLRCGKKPGLVVKKDTKLLHTPIPENLDITIHGSGKTSSHLCNNCIHVCQDCPRTKDQTVSFQLRHVNTFQDAVLNSWRPEKYRFMSEAIETFNTEIPCESLVVLRCDMHCSSS